MVRFRVYLRFAIVRRPPIRPVFIENNAFGVTARLGLDVEDVMSLIAAKRPERGIIYCRSNAYGFDGPMKVAPGYEVGPSVLSGSVATAR